MSGSDSLVATRARRANAGSRLKQLIEIEEQSTGVSNIVYSEDDENVQLLFQEDENDGEFEESDEDSSGLEEVEEEDDEKNENDRDEESNSPSENQDNDISNGDDKISDTELAVNSDEMLSDSDLSASDDDDSEGERELQKNEREKKRKTKTSTIIPAIKKPKLSSEKPKPKSRPKTKHSELLLNLDRRASSRKSAMRNKEILVKKLKEDETRRAALTPVVRVDEVQLTQEERLAQAVETEKENVLSLHSFLEQEIVKKEHQKLLFQQRRLKLRNVVRIVSKETFVAPIDEIEDAIHVQDLFDKKKKGRRRKNTSDVPEEPRPGDIDKELPYYKKEMEEKRIQDEKEALERERIEREQEEERLKIAEQEAKRTAELEKDSDSKESDEVVDAEIKSLDGKQDDETKDSDVDTMRSESESQLPTTESSSAVKELPGLADNGEDKPEEENIDKFDENSVVSETGSDLVSQDMAKTQKESDEIENDFGQNEVQTTVTNAPTQDEETLEKIVESNAIEDLEANTALPCDTKNSVSSTEQDGTTIEEKKVKFADDHIEKEELKSEEILDELDESDEGLETNISYRASKDGRVFEGPVQQVGRNNIILIDFDDEEYPLLSETKVKTLLFGKDANLGASRRFKDVKTILKSSIRSDNPYAAPKEEREDERLKPVSEITEDDTMFEALKKLPRLGVKETFEVEEEDVQKEETTEIQIRTEAPSGLYLPNGNKKLCLISGKEVRYFDPATGLPYENKDVYKVIKTIESGLIPWYSIGKDQNTYGDIEIYLNHRNGSRHAKGVPDGFDGC